MDSKSELFGDRLTEDGRMAMMPVTGGPHRTVEATLLRVWDLIG
jgi:hypothetical protein